MYLAMDLFCFRHVYCVFILFQFWINSVQRQTVYMFNYSVTVSTMQQILQDFQSVSDHFGILCIKGLRWVGSVGMNLDIFKSMHSQYTLSLCLWCFQREEKGCSGNEWVNEWAKQKLHGWKLGLPLSVFTAVVTTLFWALYPVWRWGKWRHLFEQ